MPASREGSASARSRASTSATFCREEWGPQGPARNGGRAPLTGVGTWSRWAAGGRLGPQHDRQVGHHRGIGEVERSGDQGHVASVGGKVLAVTLSRLVSAWGATDDDLRRPLPCDRVLPDADVVVHRAVDVEAPPELVFRWLCQLRAG